MDEIQVLDTDDLLRRVVYINPNYVRPDLTVTSFAFTPRKINGVLEDGVSVDIARLTTLEKSIADKLKYRLYSVKAGAVRTLGLDCRHAPVEGNDAHALIIGHFKTSTCKKLAQTAVRVQFPD